MSVLDRFLLGRARQSPAAFAGLVLRDEATGAPVTLAPQHRGMHRLWSAGDRSVVWAFAEGGKSTQLIARVAWELGRNPALRVNYVSGTVAQACRSVRAISRLLESPGYQRVFPHVRIQAQRDGGFTLAGRPPSMKDPSVTPGGLGLGSVLGQRFDLVVGDDLLDLDSTRTPQGRGSAWTALVSVHLSRLAPGGRVWLAGTAWHSDDALCRAAALSGWRSAKFPVMNTSGVPTWPARWPSDRIEQRKLELGPLQFSRVMMCEPLDEDSLVFRLEHVEAALAAGRDPAFATPAGARCIIACDPAWTVNKGSDESGIVCVAIDSSKVRHVFHVEGRRVHHDALVSRVIELARANRATVYCESNGAGAVIADLIGRQVPCKALPTTRTSKLARVEALSAELASGRWVFPCPLGAPGPELRKLCDELVAFQLDAHPGDRCSALLLACEGARAFDRRPRGGFRHINLNVR